MEEHTPSSSLSDERFQDIAQSLAESRARAREVLFSQRDDLDKLESGLSEHIRLIAQELAQDRGDLELQHKDLRDQTVLLKQQEEKLRTGQQGWEDIEKEVRHQQEEMAKFLQGKQDELDSREQQLREHDAQSQSMREVAKAADEQVREQEQTLQRSQQRLERKEQALDSKLDKAAQQRSATKSQRRRIASELKQQRLELDRERKEVEQLRISEDESHAQQTVELARLREELQASREQSMQLQENLASQSELQESRSEELDGLRSEKEALQAEHDTLHDERDALHKQHENVRADLEAMRAEQGVVAKERARLATEVEQLRNSGDEGHVRHASETDRLKEDLQAADEAREQLQQELTAVRKSQKVESDTHDALRAEKEALLAERNTLHEERDTLRKKHEGLSADLEMLRAEHDASCEDRDQLTTELEQARTELQTVADGSVDVDELDQVRRKCELALEDTRQLKQRNSELEEELSKRPDSGGASEAELVTLRAERETLIQRLAELEIKASQAAEDSESQQKVQNLQRRFEMAVEDVRELKIINSDLKEELADSIASQKTTTPIVPSGGGNLDWEAQKIRLLASLEEFDDDDEEDCQDRLTIEGTIHITDEIVADKEREIEELKGLLDQQSSNLGDVAVGAAAIAGMLDQDELICEERERLVQVQSQWKEKLRTAEIDMSVERAKMARERMELESRAESLELEIAKRAAEVVKNGGGEALSKSKGGNWLKRLGLKDSED